MSNKWYDRKDTSITRYLLIVLGLTAVLIYTSYQLSLQFNKNREIIHSAGVLTYVHQLSNLNDHFLAHHMPPPPKGDHTIETPDVLQVLNKLDTYMNNAYTISEEERNIISSITFKQKIFLEKLTMIARKGMMVEVKHVNMEEAEQLYLVLKQKTEILRVILEEKIVDERLDEQEHILVLYIIAFISLATGGFILMLFIILQQNRIIATLCQRRAHQSKDLIQSSVNAQFNQQVLKELNMCKSEAHACKVELDHEIQEHIKDLSNIDDPTKSDK